MMDLKKQMKKAILVVSFGTSHLQALEEDICSVERALGAAFPDRELRRAFTSGVIRRKLLRRDGIKVDGVVEALEALRLENFEDVLVQPTHILNGVETERLMAEARLYALVFERFAVGQPLLSSTEDYARLADAIMEEMPNLGYDGALVLMGHGTGHFINAAYPAMEYVFHDRGYGNVFVGTVEGYPTIQEVIRRLDEQLNVRRVLVAPMLLVAGEHVRRDMAGEHPESWVNQLTAHNYRAQPLLRGLGAYESVCRMYVEHAQAALGAK